MKVINLKKLYPYFAIIIASVFLVIFLNSVRETSTSPIKQKIVIIDAGHGTPDGGASAKDGTMEKDINLEIAKKLKKHLQKSGAKVIMTREDDNSLSNSKTNNKREDLNKRMHIRNNSNADIFVSIHMNHFSDPKYYGAQVFYNSSAQESQILAECIQKNLIEIADPSNKRQIKQNNEIFVLKNAQYPCVLVECGFLSNPEEAKKLSQDDYQRKIAKAVYKGICDFFEI